MLNSEHGVTSGHVADETLVESHYAVVRDSDGGSWPLLGGELLEHVAYRRRLAEEYAPGSFDAEFHRDIAHRLEQAVLAGQVDDELLEDVFDLGSRCVEGPVSDPTLGPLTVGVWSLGSVRPWTRPRSVRTPARRPVRLIGVRPRRRESRRRARAPARGDAGDAGDESDHGVTREAAA